MIRPWNLQTLFVTIGVAGTLGLTAHAQTRTYFVTISNLTPTIGFDVSTTNTPPKAPNFRPKFDFSSQPFTTPVFATHNSAYVMWRNGNAATPQIRLIAEDGFNKKPGNFADPSYMVGSLQLQQAAGHVLNYLEVPNPNFNAAGLFANSSGDVFPATIPFPLTNWVPSQSDVSFVIASDKAHHFLSGAFMLIRTNDAFSGLDSIDLKHVKSEKSTFYVYAYDSGTEKNTEAHDDLVYFDSPPSGHIPEDINAVIHPHTGIVGGAGSILGPFAWTVRRPVAKITIYRVHPQGDRDGDDDDDD